MKLIIIASLCVLGVYGSNSGLSARELQTLLSSGSEGAGGHHMSSGTLRLPTGFGRTGLRRLAPHWPSPLLFSSLSLEEASPRKRASNFASYRQKAAPNNTCPQRSCFFQPLFKDAKNLNRRGAPGGGKCGQKPGGEQWLVWATKGRQGPESMRVGEGTVGDSSRIPSRPAQSPEGPQA